MAKKTFNPISVAPIEQTAEQAEEEVKNYFGEGPIMAAGPAPSDLTPTDDINELFGEDAPAVDLERLEGMAEQLALMKERIDELKAELLTLTVESGKNKGTGKFDILSKALHIAMVNNHCLNGHKFDSGLNPVPHVKEDYFKKGEVEDVLMFAWLRKNDLGDNIKEMVPWNRLSSVIKAHQEQGNEIPEDIFVKRETPTIRFGRSLKPWLAKRKES